MLVIFCLFEYYILYIIYIYIYIYINIYILYYREKCKQKSLVFEKFCGSENNSYFFGNRHSFFFQ